MQSTAKRKQRDAKHWPGTYSYLFQILFALCSDVYGGYTNNLQTNTGEGIAQIRGDDSFKFGILSFSRTLGKMFFDNLL
jgi:hypothetical protein